MKKLLDAFDRLLLAAERLSESLSRSTERMRKVGNEMEVELERIRSRNNEAQNIP